MIDFRRIYVLGGHKLSSTYLKHLCRAAEEGLISIQSLSFVDPSPQPHALGDFSGRCAFIQKSYADFVTGILDQPDADLEHDYLIPDHTAPHVLFQTFLQLLKTRGKKASVIPFHQALSLPFQKILESGICAVSFATWMCPLECEEPAQCPAIEKERTWDLGFFLKSQDYEGIHSTHFFGCEQIAYGVCGIPLTLIRDEFKRLENALKPGHTFLVGTHSKCHGILGLGQIT